MHIENGRLIMGRKNCTNCQDGTKSTIVPCKKCNGTGKGIRGGRGGCRTCYGTGGVHDHDNRAICNSCKGDYKGAEAETITDYIPYDIYRTIPVRVIRQQNYLTPIELLLGTAGALYTSSGTGDSDESLVKEVEGHRHTQACKVCRDDGTLCSYIGVIVLKNGYTVQAFWE